MVSKEPERPGRSDASGGTPHTRLRKCPGSNRQRQRGEAGEGKRKPHGGRREGPAPCRESPEEETREKTRQETCLQEGALPVGGVQPAAQGLPRGGPICPRRGTPSAPGPQRVQPGPGMLTGTVPDGVAHVGPLWCCLFPAPSLRALLRLDREGWKHLPLPVASVLNRPPLLVAGPLSSVGTHAGLRLSSGRRGLVLQGRLLRDASERG